MLKQDDLHRLRNSLFSGKYNLLIGAGASLDSTERDGKTNLPSGWQLQQHLCKLKGVSTDRPLTRVYQLLTETERERELTKRFSLTNPGRTVKQIPNFIWKQIYTFNIDDTLELAYRDESVKTKQKASAVNFDKPFTSPQSHKDIQIVHLHGYAPDPESGYVFSQVEYAKIAKSINPWMTILAQTLATEPFIIAGTSLSEPDLEFYLSHRSAVSGRQDRGPSILVEPFPDAITENDCKRHGLILVKSTLNDFLTWLQAQLGEVPSLETVILPSIDGLFDTKLPALSKISFFSSVDIVRPVAATTGAGETSGFFFGQHPTWADLESDIDIATPDTNRLVKKVDLFLSGAATLTNIVVVTNEPGTGKSTNLRRVAYDLAKNGRVVFFLKKHADVDYDDMLNCFRAVQSRCVLFVDGAAENVSFLRLLLEKEDLADKLFIVCAERDYRESHILSNLEAFNVDQHTIAPWKRDNYIRLIEKFRQNGLLASSDAVKNPENAALQLANEPVAIGACRLLNNFRPFEQIIHSIWVDASDEEKRSYLTAALAEHCVPDGIKYSILQAAQNNKNLDRQLSLAHPLPLGYSHDDDDYVLPMNATIGERILELASKNSVDMLLDIFVDLGNAVSPFVNRRTIMARTAEARLSGRLFHAEDVVTKFLRDKSEIFYIRTKRNWEWNSRYWEQRALELGERNITLAIQYARHAVAIEAHSFPWTTLASLLMRTLNGEPTHRERIFSEAFDLLIKALDFDAIRLRRHSRHAYLALFRGTEKFILLGGKLSKVNRGEILTRISDAAQLMKKNAQIQNVIATLTPLL